MLALLLLAAPAPFPKPAPREPAEALQGSWRRSAYTLNGAPVTLIYPDGGPIHLTVEGSVMTITQGAVTHGVWDFEMDAKRKPIAFRKKWRKRDEWFSGTIELDGDALTLRYAREGTALEKGYVCVYKRAAKGSR
ncbi:MAG: hypothetical protein K2W96_02845 [Gemmataceae bacterium]|nr:hypothetical protein [Gemmataceae bacterium]